MTRLALLIPARNAADVLPRLLESARAQTEPFDDVCLYDDASSDDTAAIARRHGVRVIRSDTNTGPSPGKNVLARATACEWVHFHDADEALGPEFVARARGWTRRDDIDVVLFTTEEREDATGRFVARSRWNDDDLRADAVRYTLLHTVTNCGVYRRQPFLSAGGFNEDPAVKYNEDQAMHIRLALAGLRFGADPYTGVIVYRRPNSMSTGHPIECARAQIDVLAEAASRTGRRYAREIGGRLWQLAGVSAGYLDWSYVSRSLSLAAELGYRHPEGEHWAVRAAARISPYGAVKCRELVIRSLKPHLRRNMPTLATSQADA